MANKQAKGRPPVKLAVQFREFCRKTINRPEVKKLLLETAQKDPVFALRLAEHGIGRPFQAVHVTSERVDGIYRSEFAEGESVHPASTPVLPEGARA